MLLSKILQLRLKLYPLRLRHIKYAAGYALDYRLIFLHYARIPECRRQQTVLLRDMHSFACIAYCALAARLLCPVSGTRGTCALIGIEVMPYCISGLRVCLSSYIRSEILQHGGSAGILIVHIAASRPGICSHIRIRSSLRVLCAVFPQQPEYHTAYAVFSLIAGSCRPVCIMRGVPPLCIRRLRRFSLCSDLSGYPVCINISADYPGRPQSLSCCNLIRGLRDARCRPLRQIPDEVPETKLAHTAQLIAQSDQRPGARALKYDVLLCLRRALYSPEKLLCRLRRPLACKSHVTYHRHTGCRCRPVFISGALRPVSLPGVFHDRSPAAPGAAPIVAARTDPVSGSAPPCITRTVTPGHPATSHTGDPHIRHGYPRTCRRLAHACIEAAPVCRNILGSYHIAVYLPVLRQRSRRMYVGLQPLHQQLASGLQREIVPTHIALIEYIYIVSDAVDRRDQRRELRDTIDCILLSYLLIHKIDRRQVCFSGWLVSCDDLRSKSSITRQSVKGAYIRNSHRQQRRTCYLPRGRHHLHIYGIGTSWIPLCVISIVLYSGRPSSASRSPVDTLVIIPDTIP